MGLTTVSLSLTNNCIIPFYIFFSVTQVLNFFFFFFFFILSCHVKDHVMFFIVCKVFYSFIILCFIPLVAEQNLIQISFAGFFWRRGWEGIYLQGAQADSTVWDLPTPAQAVLRQIWCWKCENDTGFWQGMTTASTVHLNKTLYKPSLEYY